MAQPSTQDFTAPFDPTAYTSIDGAELLQYLQGAYPGTDVGLVVTTTDTAGNPNVPDATTNTKWKKYIWKRISPTTNSITLYVWNPNAAADVTYLYWTPAFAAAIGAGTIQGYQIAANTITDGNIANVNWSKITGAPTSLPPSGAAGPTVLSGTYPDPSIKNLGITSAMIAQNAITGGSTGKIATGANGATLGDNLAPTAGSTLGSPTGGAAALAANDRVVVNAAKTGYCTVQKVIDALAEPAVGDALKVVQVNSGGTGFQYAAATGFGKVLQTVVQRLSAQTTIAPGTSGITGQILKTATPQISISSGVLTAVGTASNYRTGSQFGLGVNITPISNNSYLKISMKVFACSDVSDILTLAVYSIPGANFTSTAAGIFTLAGNLAATDALADATTGYAVAGKYAPSGQAQDFNMLFFGQPVGYVAGTQLNLLPLIGVNNPASTVWINSFSNASTVGYGTARLQSVIIVEEVLL